MKKKKLTYNSLALGNLKNRKKQYIVLILAIILSMVFSSSTVFLMSSAFSSAKETKYYRYGKEDLTVFNVQEMKNFNETLKYAFPECGYAHILGFAKNKKVEGDDFGSSIAWLDETATSLYADVAEGRMPEKENEIAIEKTTLTRLGFEGKLNEKINLKIFKQNGTQLQEKYYYREYILVGILNDKKSNLENVTFFSEQYPSIFVVPNTPVEAGGKESVMAFAFCDAYFKLPYYNDCLQKLQNTPDYMENITQFDEITMYTNYQYNLNTGESGFTFLFLIILSLVFSLICNLGIINAFATTLKERTKQIGLLRAVGTTKRQIVKLYLREAFLLCLLCTPVSLIISFAFVALFIPVLGSGYIFKPQWWVFPVTFISNVIFVVFSALFPLIFASRVTPVQAIRNIENTRKFAKKKIKTQKEFNCINLLAKRRFVLEKKSGVLTSIILCITIVISAAGFALLAGIKASYGTKEYDYHSNSGMTYRAEYINTPFTNKGYSENDKNEILNNPFVKSVKSQKSTRAFIMTDELTDFMRLNMYSTGFFSTSYENAVITKDNYRDLLEKKNIVEPDEAQKILNTEKELSPILLASIDDSEIQLFDKYVIDGKIDKEKLDSGEEVILFVSEAMALTSEALPYEAPFEEPLNFVYAESVPAIRDEAQISDNEILFAKNDFKVGQKLDLGWIFTKSEDDVENKIYSKNSAQTTIGAIIYELPYSRTINDISFRNNSDNITAITSLEGINNLTSPDLPYNTFTITSNCEVTQEIDTSITSMLDKINATSDGELFSHYQIQQEQNTEFYSMYLVMLSVTMLFFAASGSMINNSITARIKQNKKSIGTLRAVGASVKEVSLSYLRQFFTVFGIGTLSGITLSLLLYGIYYIIFTIAGDSPNDFVLTFHETAIALVLLFSICCFNIFSKVRKEMKHSIVENIREL